MDEIKAQDIVDQLTLIAKQLGELTQACGAIAQQLSIMNRMQPPTLGQ